MVWAALGFVLGALCGAVACFFALRDSGRGAEAKESSGKHIQQLTSQRQEARDALTKANKTFTGRLGKAQEEVDKACEQRDELGAQVQGLQQCNATLNGTVAALREDKKAQQAALAGEKKKTREWKEQAAAQEPALRKANKHVERLEDAGATLQKQLEEERGARVQAEQLLEHTKSDVKAAVSKVSAELNARLQTVQAEFEATRQERDSSVQLAQSAQSTAERLSQENERGCGQIKDLRERLEDVTATGTAAQQRCNTQEQELGSLKQQLSEVQCVATTLQGKDELCAVQEKELQGVKEALGRVSAEKETLSDQREHLQAHVGMLQDNRTQVVQELEKVQQQLSAEQRNKQEFEEDRRLMASTVDSLNAELEALKVEHELTARKAARAGKDLEALQGAADEKTALASELAQAHATVARVQQQLDEAAHQTKSVEEECGVLKVQLSERQREHAAALEQQASVASQAETTASRVQELEKELREACSRTEQLLAEADAKDSEVQCLREAAQSQSAEVHAARVKVEELESNLSEGGAEVEKLATQVVEAAEESGQLSSQVAALTLQLEREKQTNALNEERLQESAQQSAGADKLKRDLEQAREKHEQGIRAAEAETKAAQQQAAELEKESRCVAEREQAAQQQLAQVRSEMAALEETKSGAQVECDKAGAEVQKLKAMCKKLLTNLQQERAKNQNAVKKAPVVSTLPVAGGDDSPMSPDSPYKVIDTEGACFSAEQLRSADLPDGVDASQKEQYLAADEFSTLFEMDNEAFAALPKWKRKELKKKFDMF